MEGGRCSYLPMDLLWCCMTLRPCHLMRSADIFWISFLCKVSCSFHSISMVLGEGLQDLHSSVHCHSLLTDFPPSRFTLSSVLSSQCCQRNPPCDPLSGPYLFSSRNCILFRLFSNFEVHYNVLHMFPALLLTVH